MNKPIFILPIILLITLVISSCHTVPVTGRSALSLVSDEKVIQMSVQQFDEMKAQTGVSYNKKYNAIVQRVGQRIAAAAADDIPDADWEFVVFESPQINAFAMAGGKVGVFTGMFDVIENDDDLAIVMGHEIAHVGSKHVNERFSQEYIKQGGRAILGTVAGQMSSQAGNVVMQVYGIGSTLGSLGFNRKQESEADHVGLMYAARAGYDPRRAVTFWQNMDIASQGQSTPPEFFSTHPSHDNRIDRLNEIMPKAVAEYEYQKDIKFLESVKE